MNAEPLFTTAPLEPARAQEAAELVAATIEGLPFYNRRAKAEEIARYGRAQLVASVEGDPDSVLIASSDGQLAGFCISTCEAGLVWLSWFGVAASHRRRGVGSALLRELATTLARRGAHKIWCDTVVENVVSQSVLKAFGFRETARFSNHWYGHDFFIWEWTP